MSTKKLFLGYCSTNYWENILEKSIQNNLTTTYTITIKRQFSVFSRKNSVIEVGRQYYENVFEVVFHQSCD
jgi:hypothetical protein